MVTPKPFGSAIQPPLPSMRDLAPPAPAVMLGSIELPVPALTSVRSETNAEKRRTELSLRVGIRL